MELNKIFRRQLDLVKPQELEFPIHIIGGGGIGSWATFALVKMGCSNITVIDPDRVEEKNTPSQLYNINQVGQNKVDALADNIRNLTGVEIKKSAVKYQDYRSNGFTDAKLIICSVDSLEERKNLWSPLLSDWFLKRNFECYIDARMGGELLRVLLVNPFDEVSLNYYQKVINSKTKAHSEPCTARSIIYNTFICGGIIASLVKKYAKKEEVKLDFIFDIKNGTTN